MMTPSPLTTDYAPAIAALAMHDEIFIGATSAVLAAPRDPSQRRSKRLQQFETMLSAEHYAAIFPVVEHSHHLSGLPSPTFIQAMNTLPLRNVWRLMITDVATEKRFFSRDEWPLTIAAIAHASRPPKIILALDRTCEFDPSHLEHVIEIANALQPVKCLLEFEHHSWTKAERVLRGAKIGVVQLDAPSLPGIVKNISLPGNEAHLRLLGRNAKDWFAHHASERFAYHYTERELAAIAGRVREMLKISESVTIVFANYPAASALENAAGVAALMCKEER